MNARDLARWVPLTLADRAATLAAAIVRPLRSAGWDDTATAAAIAAAVLPLAVALGSVLAAI